MSIEFTNVKPAIQLPSVKFIPTVKITKEDGSSTEIQKKDDGSYQLYSAAPPGFVGFKAARLTEKEALGEILHELCLLA